MQLLTYALGLALAVPAQASAVEPMRCACGPDAATPECVARDPDGSLELQYITALGNQPAMWRPSPPPAFVALEDGKLSLYQVDPMTAGYAAFYVGAPARGPSQYRLVFYACDGQRVWSLDLHAHLEKPAADRIFGAVTRDDVVYFNESGDWDDPRNGAVTAVDRRAGKVLWRSPGRVSVGRIRVAGDYLVSYMVGSRKEQRLTVLRRSDGTIAASKATPGDLEDLWVDGEVVHLALANDDLYFTMKGLAAGKVTALEARRPPPRPQDAGADLSEQPPIRCRAQQSSPKPVLVAQGRFEPVGNADGSVRVYWGKDEHTVFSKDRPEGAPFEGGFSAHSLAIDPTGRRFAYLDSERINGHPVLEVVTRSAVDGALETKVLARPDTPWIGGDPFWAIARFVSPTELVFSLGCNHDDEKARFFRLDLDHDDRARPFGEPIACRWMGASRDGKRWAWFDKTGHGRVVLFDGVSGTSRVLVEGTADAPLPRLGRFVADPDMRWVCYTRQYRIDYHFCQSTLDDRLVHLGTRSPYLMSSQVPTLLATWLEYTDDGNGKEHYWRVDLEAGTTREVLDGATEVSGATPAFVGQGRFMLAPSLGIATWCDLETGALYRLPGRSYCGSGDLTHEPNRVYWAHQDMAAKVEWTLFATDVPPPPPPKAPPAQRGIKAKP